ncbi:hypothetical protein EVG20_g9082 [Dentipellis fragilis]|uniref:Trimethylguanosine synthase n=1 Tax=Dentipellis fragilis TaxID=205917 RepID=A0A4Y9Y5F8_9AGAM|nr:hypothetical protein EVG20_g9082 [Dentipellis fragilis]
MSTTKFRVAICGGGIGGLTLAVTLGRYGDIPVDIYESAPEIGTLGAGLAVSKRTWDVMRRLGFESEMKKRGFSVPQEGECLVMLFRRSDQAEPGVDVCRVVAPYNMIPLHRMHLMEMLQALLPANCTIHTSKRFTTYTRNTDGSLTLHFADGHTAVTDVLVGADGIHSAVRGAVGSDLLESGFLPDGLRSSEALLKSIDPKWTGTVLYRSLIAPEKVRPEHSVWTGEITCHLIAYPVSNGAFINFLAFYTVPGGEGTSFTDKWVAEAPKEDVIAPFEGWESDVQELLQALDTTALRWTPHVMESVPFAAHGRVAILGDADAYLLGRILSHNDTTPEIIPQALQIYQDIRLSFSQAVVARSRETGLMYEFNGPEYDGVDREDEESLGRWRKRICDRWQFQWNEDPEGQWEEAESRLRPLYPWARAGNVQIMLVSRVFFLNSLRRRRPHHAPTSQPSTNAVSAESSETLTSTQREPFEDLQTQTISTLLIIRRPDEEAEVVQPPTKKRKTTPAPPPEPITLTTDETSITLDQKVTYYDASILGPPHYTDATQVPEHLQKYFAQRHRFFSLYDEGCLLDEEGWYSVTPEAVADQIAERCRCGTVLDAFCGVGGNAIAFARTCERVIALDISPIRLALARHNAEIYGVADRIEFILADYMSFARSIRADPANRPIDVVFLSPPWGGPAYLDGTTNPIPDSGSVDPPVVHPEYSLTSLKPASGTELVRLARGFTRNIALYIPRNSRLDEIAALGEILSEDSEVVGMGGGKAKTKLAKGGKRKGELIEIEEEWMGNKLKALTCYFGGLVAEQEHLFDEA